MQTCHRDLQEPAVAGEPHAESRQPARDSKLPTRARQGRREQPDMTATRDRWGTGQAGAAGELDGPPEPKALPPGLPDD